MKYPGIHIAALVVSLIALPAVVIFEARTSRGQSPTPGKSSAAETTDSRVKPTVLMTDSRAGTAPESSSAGSTFGPAAARNAVLRNELTWTFGGKHQRGWYLYTPLIARLLDTEEDVTSGGFAAALTRWQKKSGLAPTGILDEASLYGMISEWQGGRLKDRSYARPEQLITAPVSDFYDMERVEELRQVERETYAAYMRLIAAAVAEPSLGLTQGPNGGLATGEKYLKILSSFRSREYQERLRRQSPNAGSAGLATNSPHFTGRALDLYVGGDPVDTKDSNRAIQVQTDAYKWLVRNADRFGFRPYYYEPWHWEYVK